MVQSMGGVVRLGDDKFVMTVSPADAPQLDAFTTEFPLVSAAVRKQPSGPELVLFPLHWTFTKPVVVSGIGLAAGLLVGIIVGRWSK